MQYFNNITSLQKLAWHAAPSEEISTNSNNVKHIQCNFIYNTARTLLLLNINNNSARSIVIHRTRM